MKDMITAFVYENGEDTNGRFMIPYKKYEKNEHIDFHGHNYKIIDSNPVVAIVEEVLE